MKWWWFTFGWGQPHYGCYVVIEGENEMEARLAMVERFGRRWASQYESAEAAGVETWGLKEIKSDTP